MKCGIVAGAVLALIASTGIASADARLEGVKGPVSVNSGDGFQPALGPVQLQPGDKVMVDRGGGAVIAYGGDCNVSVKPGAVAVVSETSPCLRGSDSLQQGTSAGLIGEGGAAGIGALMLAPIAGLVVYGAVSDDNDGGGGGVSP